MSEIGQETRAETIARHTASMRHERRSSWESFGQAVIEAYHAMVPESARTIAFRTGGDVFECAAVNAKKISRYIDRESEARLPVDLEEAWVQAMPEPYRTRCRDDLVRRHGCLPVMLISDMGTEDAAGVAQFATDFAAALREIAPAIADGVFNATDLPYVDAITSMLDRHVASTLALRARMLQIRDEGDKAHG